MELTFDFVKSKWKHLNKEVTHEAIFNDLLNQVSELADMRTGSRNSADMMAKTISAVRGVDAFSHFFINPLEGLQAFNSALRSCASETARTTIRSSSFSGSQYSERDPKSFAVAVEELAET